MSATHFMGATLETSLNERAAAAERQHELLGRLRKQEEQQLRMVAAITIVTIFGVVPVAGLSGMVYMSGSAFAPLCLAGIILLVGSISYRLLSWMFIESAEERSEPRPSLVTDQVPHPAPWISQAALERATALRRIPQHTHH